MVTAASDPENNPHCEAKAGWAWLAIMLLLGFTSLWGAEMGVAEVELYEAIKDLVNQCVLVKGTVAYGVAQQVMHDGYERLTYAQRVIFDAVVVPLLKRRKRELEALRHANFAS